VCCSVLQCVAMCGSVLPCVTVCCDTLYCGAVMASHCNILQHTAAHCSTLQHTATHCNTLENTATQFTHTFRLQYVAVFCHKLCVATNLDSFHTVDTVPIHYVHIHTYTHFPPHAATYCNILQHTLQSGRTCLSTLSYGVATISTLLQIIGLFCRK